MLIIHFSYGFGGVFVSCFVKKEDDGNKTVLFSLSFLVLLNEAEEIPC